MSEFWPPAGKIVMGQQTFSCTAEASDVMSSLVSFHHLLNKH